MFGDGGSSHATNPSHTYDAPGSFDVTLTVQDSAGAEDSLVKISYITVSPGTTPLVANPDTAHYTPGNTSTIHIDVLANDQGQSLSVTGVTQPASGTASASDGTEVTYTPVSGTSGSQIFEYTVTDAHDATATSDVTVSPTGAVTITLHWIGPPRDLDLHTLLPDDFGELAYYSQCQPSGTNAHPCPPGDWASQDHDETQAGTGNETHTITADGGTFHAGDYVVSVVNFACDDTFANSAASVTFTRANGAVTTINLPASASDQKTWNVGTMTLASNGTGTVSATNTFDATTGCGSSVVTAQSRHAAVAPGSPAETVADGLSEVTQVTATMVGDGAHLEWEATGDPHAIARFSTERFPETSIDGALGCEGDGTCDLVGLAAGTRYYVTIFPDWMLSTTPVEGVNAITVDIPAGTSSGDGTTTDPAPATDPAPTPDPTPTESTPPPPPSDPAATESTSPPPEPAPSDPPPPDPAPAPDGGTSA